ncbi:protein HGH1 homolog [Apostichopus japonicus]|uniref:protein HGH1 homolog n=1 Tax=Stichopus japonicus TaxID=307972 RepID=UPI003AB41644
MDETVLDEFVSFLSQSAKPALREKALEYVVGLSGSEEGLRSLETRLPNIVAALLELVEDANKSFVEDVFKALINLCSYDKTAPKVTEKEAVVSKLLSTICDSSFEFANHSCTVLSNLSRNSHSCGHILACLENQKSDTGGAMINLAKLVEVFCKEGYNPKAALHPLGSVLANLTQRPEARKFILDKDQCVIQRLLPYTQYTASDVRRRGVVTALKNCCFEIDYHEWLLSDSVDILPYLLLPLAGPEQLNEDEMEGMPEDLQYLDEDKEREPDPAIRKLLIDTLTKLCTTKPGREMMKAKRAYIIMREFDKWERNEQLNDICQDLIQHLIGDEPSPGMENLEQVEIPTEMREKFDKLTAENPRVVDEDLARN